MNYSKKHIQHLVGVVIAAGSFITLGLFLSATIPPAPEVLAIAESSCNASNVNTQIDFAGGLTSTDRLENIDFGWNWNDNMICSQTVSGTGCNTSITKSFTGNYGPGTYTLRVQAFDGYCGRSTSANQPNEQVKISVLDASGGTIASNLCQTSDLGNANLASTSAGPCSFTVPAGKVADQIRVLPTHTNQATPNSVMVRHVSIYGTATPAPNCSAGTFSASPATITSGNSSTLSWSGITGATSYSINQGVGTVTGSSKSVSPTVTTTYTLTATNAGGSCTKQATVTVNAAASCTVSASPTSITSGQSTTLSWSGTGVNNYKIDGTAVTGTSKSYSPTATKTYTLTGHNSSGTQICSDTVQVAVSAAASCTANIKANGSNGPITIASGDAVDFTVTASGQGSGKTIKIYNASDSQVKQWTSAADPFSGSYTQSSVTGQGPFEVQVQQTNGTVICSDTVQINLGASTPAPTVNLQVSDTSITLGDSVDLTWSSTNASSCTASASSGGNWSGTKSTSNSSGDPATPSTTGSKTYTLTCSGTTAPPGSDSVTVSVTNTPVVDPPYCEISAQDNSVTSGTSPRIDWYATDHDYIIIQRRANGASSWTASSQITGSSNTYTAPAITVATDYRCQAYKSGQTTYTSGIDSVSIQTAQCTSTECGDDECEGSETAGNCPLDCASNPTCRAYDCGNGTCSSGQGETANNCPADCPSGSTQCTAASTDCGNGTCESGETATSCKADCATIPTAQTTGGGNVETEEF